jgi:hypothetical protein
MRSTLDAVIFVALGAIPTLAADTTPPAAKKVTIADSSKSAIEIAKEIKAQTGIDIEVAGISSKPISVNFQKLDFWHAVERLAKDTGSRVAISNDGRIRLRPGMDQGASHVAGPFRFSSRGVLIRGDVPEGSSNYTLSIDLAWEPWLNAYRVDTYPKIESVTDDTGKSFSVAGGADRSFAVGNWKELTVRPQGVTRASKSLTVKGSVMITIADKLLTFTFDPTTGKSIGQATQDGVTVKFAQHGAEGNDWFATVQLDYPKSEVVWQSFEYAWHRNNVMRLLPPKGEPIVADIIESADLRYGFKNRKNQIGKDWKLDYRTPGPMREIVVPFELKDIRLP